MLLEQINIFLFILGYGSRGLDGFKQISINRKPHPYKITLLHYLIRDHQ
jgi:hypothetical protein